MWKPTWLFSLLFLLSPVFADPLKESISLKVKVVGKIVEEKPKLLPPDLIKLNEDVIPLDLSRDLLEPPRSVEPAYIEPLKEGRGCGEPKDRAKYRAGIDYYLKGNIKKAESRMLDVLSIQNSAFVPQAEYILGLIYSEKGKEGKALKFFVSSCNAQHPFKIPACESYYALEFKLRGEPYPADSPDLWKIVYEIKKEGKLRSPDCSETIFSDYCTYISDFVEGKINEGYLESTELRRAIILVKRGELKKAKEILIKHSTPLKKYRDVALYYLGLIAAKEGNSKQAYRYASLLETSNPEYSRNLYLILSRKDFLLSRIAYQLTGSKKALRNTGIISYNRGNYSVAYAELIKAGDYLTAAWAAIKEGDYQRAYRSIKESGEKNRNYYLWLLEILYWLGKDKEMEKVLEGIRRKYPELYREYYGWLMFRKENWLKAYKNFKDPYHKALALFNAGRYSKVIELLKNKKNLRDRILKAKAAISMGKGKLARRFLTDESSQEIYLLGMSFFIEGDYREAISYFKKLLKEDSFKSRAMLRIADSYYNLGNYDKAKEIYKEILTLYPDSGEALDATLALAQIELQRPSADLERVVKSFVRKFPDSPMVPDLKYQLALFYLKEGREKEAKDIFKELIENRSYRAKVLIKLAELEEDPNRKEKLLKEAILEGGSQEKEKATELLKNLYLQRREFEKLADFLREGGYEDRKRALDIYISENIQKAIDLFDELQRENPDDEDLKGIALKMYDKTKGKKYLLFAKESQRKEVRARALYLLGKVQKDKRKALEYFVEVILSAEGVQPYYNRSILEAADILISLRAKRDASCLLERLDLNNLTGKELKKVKILRKRLPKCEVK